MPKIKAATVAEHREQQERAILDAARAIVVEQGLGALGFAAIAARTGLARSSLYEYFGSTTKLLEALVESEFPPWRAEIESALASVPSARDQVAVFIEVQLRLVAEGRHQLAFELARSALDAEVSACVAEQHAQLVELLRAPVKALGVRAVDTALLLVGSMLGVAFEGVREGRDWRALSRAVIRFALGGLDALAEPPVVRDARPSRPARPSRRSSRGEAPRASRGSEIGKKTTRRRR